jgi:hypothetical protein
MIQKPKISEAFTLDDIRKIRDYDYEMIKNMNTTELISYYETGSKYVRDKVAALRSKRAVSSDYVERAAP